VDDALNSPISEGAAAVIVPSSALADEITFFEDLGWSLTALVGADDPVAADLSGHGIRLRIVNDTMRPTPHIIVEVDIVGVAGLGTHTAPGGTSVEIVRRPGTDQVPVPPAVLDDPIITHLATTASTAGRAGMRYHDLLPGRLGGHLIASLIAIPDGGPVADYVHHHAIDFQLIFCARGWVDVVYEDQGPPMRLSAGDCVLQPPHIRHRVLEASPGLEVVEFASPATHATFPDPAASLPTGVLAPDRDFGGQRFAHFVGANADWMPSDLGPGVVEADTGIAAAGAAADVRVVRCTGTDLTLVLAPRNPARHLVVVCLDGDATALIGDHQDRFTYGSTAAIGPDDELCLVLDSAPLSLLLVER
jgi:quercetin dioxygenase-like cupin family protein